MRNVLLLPGLILLALLGLALAPPRAAAMAPIIGDIPAPVVGGSTGTSQATRFVYPDAINLDLLVSDDQTTPTSLLKWTYEMVGSNYLINGINPINSAVTDPVAVTDSQTINRNPAGMGQKNGVAEDNPDGKLATITIRNQHLSPLGGVPVSNPPVGFCDIQPVTFWCSDGNAVSSSTVLFYTDNYPGGYNRLSLYSRIPPCHDNCENFFNKSWKISEGPFGNVTTHTWPASGTGICLEVAKNGENYASVASPMEFLTLSPNSLYKIRLTINSSQIAPGHTPFWDIVIENAYDPVLKKGLNLYAMDAFFLDNVGGANSIIGTTSGTEVTLYWAPAAVNTPQFNNTKTGAFSPTYSANKDARVRFRVMDVDSNAALINDQKYGAICLMNICISSIPMSKLNEVSTLVDITNPASNAAKPAGTGNMEVHSYLGASVVFSGGALTITPNGAGVSNELVTVTPSASTDGGMNPAYPFTNMADEWPIPWLSNKLYEMTVDLSAPTAADEAHPFDVIWLGMDTPTNEVNCESYVTSVKGIASPKVGTPQSYTFFYNTQNETLSSYAQLHFLRWRLRFGNSTAVNFPNFTDLTNTGAVRIHRVRVRQVTPP